MPRKPPKPPAPLPTPILRGTIDSDIFNATFANPDTQIAFTDLFKEMGSPRAFFAEFLLARYFREVLTRTNQSKGFDLHSVTNGRPVEVKMASDKGVDMKPSSGKGASRTPKVDLFFANCEIGNYLIVDGIYFRDTGNIRYVVLSGLELKELGTHKLTGKQVRKLFES